MAEPISSTEARLMVLETAVAALIAQLPPASLEEVVGLLTYVSGMAEEAEETVGRQEQEQLGHVRHWVDEMLDRVMNSRKATRLKDLSSEDAKALRYPSGNTR